MLLWPGDSVMVMCCCGLKMLWRCFDVVICIFCGGNNGLLWSVVAVVVINFEVVVMCCCGLKMMLW